MTERTCRVCQKTNTENTTFGYRCRDCLAPHNEAGRLDDYPWEISDDRRCLIEPMKIRCRACDHRFQATITTMVNLAHRPEYDTELARGRLNRIACPECHTTANVVPPGFTWYDPAGRLRIHVDGYNDERPRMNFGHLPGRLVRICADVAGAVEEARMQNRHYPLHGTAEVHITESTFRHRQADRGIGLPWTHSRVALILAGQSGWSRRARGTLWQAPSEMG